MAPEPSGAGGWGGRGWTREEAPAEGCSSRKPGIFMSMDTKGEPQGHRGAGNKVCPPQSCNVTAQPCSPAQAVLLAAHPCTHPAPGGLPHWSCVYSGAPMGSWGPPKSHSMGTEPTQLMEKVGLHRVCGCSGRGACTGGRMTLERS